jgi:hypothetical protein
MSRALGHAAAAATGTETAALARERDEPVYPARLAPEPGEAGRQTPAREERAKLVFHKARQSLPVAQALGLRTEGLEVIAHELVQRLALRLAAPIAV